jgi:hypothetical protein
LDGGRRKSPAKVNRKGIMKCVKLSVYMKVRIED